LAQGEALCGTSSHGGRQYHFIYDQKTMTEAQSYCREQYTDLATIDNMEDVTTLNNMADLSQMAAWIGLYDARNSWRWSLADQMFYEDGEAEFRNWEVGQPDNYKSAEHCVAIYDNGRWRDASCTYTTQSVCFDVRPNVTFVLNNNLMSWTQAQSYCREHHTDLASVRNMAENQKVKELVALGQIVWIGLYRDSWKWSDGSNSSFRYWQTGEPNNNGGKESCTATVLTHSGKWEDCDKTESAEK
uniref:C-type lectin domain-containing protein n=1 Tax=Dicentrarchus labrax TaxID=13489 RepID=A0A8P4GP41_DICLA